MVGKDIKTCIVTPEYPPDQWGGLSRTVERAAQHLKDMGINVHVAHFTVVDNQEILLDENRRDELTDGITVHRLTVGTEGFADRPLTIWDSPFTRTLKMMYQSLELLHKEYGFDCFHSFFLYPAGYVTGLVAKKSAKPAIAAIVGNDINKYIFSPDKTAMCKSGLENADMVVALSRDLLNTADALSPVKHKGAVIYNSVSIPQIKWKRHEKHTYRIGCAGILKYAKGLPYLFKAVAELRKRHNILLELMGEIRESEQKTFEYMIDKTGIQDILSIHPPVPRDSVINWFSGLDAFVLSSVSEGCPNILMEAMAAGLPCVAARVGAVEDLIEDGKSGFMVPWGNSGAIAEALELMTILPDRGLSIGSAAREKMKEFSWEREHRAWERIYMDILYSPAPCCCTK